MKKNVKMILATALLSATMVSSMGATPVFAATSVSETLNNVTCSGSIVYSRNSSGVANGVTAMTGYGASASISATAIAYYNYGGTTRHTNPVTRTNTAGGVSATASADGLGTIKGGTGTHTVSITNSSWTGNTQIGIIS